MIGLERTIVSTLAESEFGMASKTSILSFFMAFGFTKTITNYFSGRLANRFRRDNILLKGWLIAISVPLLLIFAHSWDKVIFQIFFFY